MAKRRRKAWRDNPPSAVDPTPRKVRAKVPLMLGEHERFASTVAKALVGTTTKDGWLVIDAQNEGPQKIWLTVEKEVSTPWKEITENLSVQIKSS